MNLCIQLYRCCLWSYGLYSYGHYIWRSAILHVQARVQACVQTCAQTFAKARACAGARGAGDTRRGVPRRPNALAERFFFPIPRRASFFRYLGAGKSSAIAEVLYRSGRISPRCVSPRSLRSCPPILPLRSAVMPHIVMAYIVMAPCSYGLQGYGLRSYGLHSYGRPPIRSRPQSWPWSWPAINYE